MVTPGAKDLPDYRGECGRSFARGVTSGMGCTPLRMTDRYTQDDMVAYGSSAGWRIVRVRNCW